MAKGRAITIELDGYQFTELEASFWQNWRDTAFAMPMPEYHFNKGRSKHRFDFAWPELMLAVEIEGGVFSNGGHTRGSGYIKNLLKYNLAAELGWLVLRYHETTIEAIAQVERVYLERMRERAVGKIASASLIAVE